MKKIALLILLIFISSDVYAYSFDYEKSDGKYVLFITDNNKKISYKNAKDEYNLDDYMIYTINNQDYYFYLGQEISKAEYNEAMEEKEIDDKCTYIGANCFRVKTTEDIIKAFEKVYSLNVSDIYYLMYTSYDYEKIDFASIKNIYRDKYMTDEAKNMYIYKEYAYTNPLRLMFEYDKNVLTIDRMNIKTNKEETAKVDAFLERFLQEFDGKSDYEKIMGAYTYINNTAVYQTDVGFINFQGGYLSAYDVLIKHKAVCIGLATTFQLLMERLGVESYIVDHVHSQSDTEYITTHTYNVVKLDNAWYIVDITLDGTLNGLLKGMSDSYSLNDFAYYDIKIADSNYLDTHADAPKDFPFDYSALLDISKKIDKGEKEEQEEVKRPVEHKKNYSLEYILIIGILALIFLIIYVFTKKK